ncbi:PleD family two-component system response regulator [Patescibacteria group bacterium]
MLKKIFGRNEKTKQRILLVEDDKMLLKVLSKQLKKAGFEVIEIKNGLRVVGAAKKFLPQLILLDLILPGLDGFAVLKQLKADPVLKKIPVIVLSNLEEPADVKSARILGSTKYILKATANIKDIINEVKRILKN